MTNGPDPSALAADMLKWERMRCELDDLEQSIKDAVMQLGKTQTVGNVRASYSGGRKSYDYETAGRGADPGLIADYTTETVVIKTDWPKKLVPVSVKVRPGMGDKRNGIVGPALAVGQVFSGTSEVIQHGRRAFVMILVSHLHRERFAGAVFYGNR